MEQRSKGRQPVRFTVGASRLLAGCALVGVTAHADVVTQVLDQVATRHWMLQADGGSNYWSNGGAPTSTNDYVVPDGLTLRTPTGTGEPAFAGRSLRLDAGSTLSLDMAAGADSILLGDLVLNGGTVKATVTAGAGTYQQLNLSNHTVRVTADSTIDVENTVARRMAWRNVTLTGNGRLTVLGTNVVNHVFLVPADANGAAYEGEWVVSGGLLLVTNNPTAFGSAIGHTVLQPRQTGAESTTLQIDNTTVTGETLELVTGPTALNRVRLRTSGGVSAWDGPIVMRGTGNAQFTVEGSAATRLTLSGSLTGDDATIMMFRGMTGMGILSGSVNAPNAAFFKTGTGAWRIASTGHRWRTTQLAVGTLVLGVNNALPTTNALAMGEGGGTAAFDLGGFDQELPGISIAGGTPNNQRIGNSSTATDSRLTLKGGTSTFSGVISDRIGTGTRQVALALDNATLTLTGTNTFTGPTTVSSGTLYVRGRTVSPIAIATGSRYGGGGTCSNLTVQAGGIHAPGLAGAVGTDNLLGSYQLDGTLQAQLNGAGTGGADRVSVAGALVLGPGAVLDLSPLATVDDVAYVIADYGTLAGRFAVTNGLPDKYRVFYAYGPSGKQIAVARAAYTWDGGAGDKTWSSMANWSEDTLPPEPHDGVLIFSGTATTNAADSTTSHLDRDRTVDWLDFSTGAGLFHTLDLTGHVLRVRERLTVGVPSVSTHVTITNSVTGGPLIATNANIVVGYNGGVSTLRITAPFTLQATNGVLDIARREGAATANTTGTLDLALSPAVSIAVPTIRLAVATAQNGGQLRGQLYLSDRGTNTISASSLVMGDSEVQGNDTVGASLLRFGRLDNVLSLDTLTIARQKAYATAQAQPGGRVKLRGLSKPGTTMRLGHNESASTGTKITGIFNTTGATLDALLDLLSIGQHGGGNGGGSGAFTMDAGSVMASNVVLATTGGTVPTNTVGTLSMNGGTLVVANSLTDGRGNGVLNVQHGGLIVSNLCQVDTLNVGVSSNRTGTLTVLGAARLGTGTQTIKIGTQTLGAGNVARGRVDFSAATSVVIHAANLLLGSTPGDGQSYGTLLLSGTGSNRLTTATLSIGDSSLGGQTAQWSRLTTGGATDIDADNVYIGRRKSLGELALQPAGGTLRLGAAGDPIGFIGIGHQDVDTGANGMGRLNGSNGTLVVYATDVLLGRHDRTSAGFVGSSRGILTLDDAADDVTVFGSLTLGRASTSSATTYGELWLSGGRVRTGTLTLGDARSAGRATGSANLSGGTLAATLIQRGSRTGSSTFAFNWTGGDLAVDTFAEELVQKGGSLCPGGADTVGLTTVTSNCTVQAGQWELDVDGAGTGASDRVNVTGTLTLSPNSALHVTARGAVDDAVYVLAEYGALTGAFGSVSGLPPDTRIEYGVGPAANQIALLRGPSGTVLILR